MRPSKKDQICIGRATITVPGDATPSGVQRTLRDFGVIPAAHVRNAVELLPMTGRKVREANILIGYRAKSANTDDLERRLEKMTGYRTHVELVGTFHL